MTPAGLGARHPEVQRLRALLRDRGTRAQEHAFVLEGPRVVAGAIDRGATLDVVYLGPGADRAFASLVARLRATNTRVELLREGVLEKVGRTKTPQPVLGVVATVVEPLSSMRGSGTAVVAVGVSDPGNFGTIVRSAEAAGADGVVACGNSVDPLNPKAVRSSAGAIFGVPIMEADDPVEVIDTLRAAGRRAVGASVASGQPYDQVDLVQSCALVIGNEAHGLAADVLSRLDELVTIPMCAGESLNVAMATTVLLFEAARQRRPATR